MQDHLSIQVFNKIAMETKVERSKINTSQVLFCYTNLLSISWLPLRRASYFAYNDKIQKMKNYFDKMGKDHHGNGAWISMQVPPQIKSKPL